MSVKEKKDLLFDLIRSLHSSERTYFKKHASIQKQEESNLYIKFFDAIADATESENLYDVAKKFAVKHKVKNISRVKGYLEQALLDALNGYYVNSNLMRSLRDKQNMVMTLFAKQKYDYAIKVIADIRKKASELDHYPTILSIISQELSLATVMFDNTKDHIEYCNKRVSEFEYVSQVMKNQLIIEARIHSCTSYLTESGQNPSTNNDFLKYLEYDETEEFKRLLPGTIKLHLSHLFFKIIYFFAICDYEKCVHYGTLYKTFFIKNSHKIINTNNESNYALALFRVAMSLFRIGKYEEVQKNIALIKGVLFKTLPGKPLFELIEFGILSEMYLRNGNKQLLIETVSQYNVDGTGKKKLQNDEMIFEFLYYSFCGNILMKDTDSAKNTFRNYQLLSNKFTNLRQDLHDEFLLLHCIFLLLQHKSDECLDEVIKSTRKLKDSEFDREYHLSFLRILRSISRKSASITQYEKTEYIKELKINDAVKPQGGFDYYNVFEIIGLTH